MPRRPRRAASDSEMPTAPFWMATFSDMATLLLTFFIMIVAMSEVEVEKFQEALSYFQGHTSFLNGETITSGIQPVTAEEAREAIAASERFEELLERIEAAGLERVVEARLTYQGLHLTIADSVVFASGEAALSASAAHVLALVAGTMGPEVTGVVVEGHTDDVPIGTARYPSNWELSAARAAAVVRFLLAQPGALEPAHYEAAGYGEHRPRAPNADAEGRRRNRRVEVLLRTQQRPQTAAFSVPGLPPPDSLTF